MKPVPFYEGLLIEKVTANEKCEIFLLLCNNFLVSITFEQLFAYRNINLSLLSNNSNKILLHTNRISIGHWNLGKILRYPYLVSQRRYVKIHQNLQNSNPIWCKWSGQDSLKTEKTSLWQNVFKFMAFFGF